MVLLPEPLRPMMATTCPFSTLNDTPFRTSTWPYDLCTSCASTMGSARDMEFPFHALGCRRQREAKREVDDRDGNEHDEGLEGRVVDELGGARDLHTADDRSDRCVLHDLHREAHRRRNRQAQRLRQHDVAQ